MVIDNTSAMNAVEVMLNNYERRNTVTSSLKCGFIAGISTIGASILLGPDGVLAGALLGSTVAYMAYRNKFKSLLNNEGNTKVKASLESALLAGVGTVVGGISCGPSGTIPGAGLGALLAYFMKVDFMKDDYKSLAEVVEKDLSAGQKQELAGHVQKVISRFNIVEVAVLMAMSRDNASFQKEVLECVHSFVEKAGKL